jgi:hypothetical protein
MVCSSIDIDDRRKVSSLGLSPTSTPAEKVIVAPLEAIPPIDERYLADALESVPLITLFLISEVDLSSKLLV